MKSAKTKTKAITKKPKSTISNPQPAISSSWQLRPVDGQGAYTKYFKSFIPRKVEADFYEFLREGIPIIDTAINRLVSLDGHVVVKGYNETIVDEIQEWIDNVAVNDVQKGVQAFHQNLSNEAFEQGFGFGEFVTDRKRTDITGLRVADSKFIQFKRTTTGLDIYQKANDDLDYRLLNPVNLMYFSINNENQNPSGTALMRSCEFAAKILVTIQNSILNVWERFGDPSFSIIYKTSKKDGAEHEKRRKTLQDEFDTAIRAKRAGQSADFVRAIDKDSDIIIKIIGADGQVLEAEVPLRHVLEQICGKTGLPPWMLSLHWSTTERLSNAEAEMLLADVATRQAAKMPLFTNLVKMMLLLRGRTWKKRDWWLEWGQVNLHDIVQQAQARFLNAQGDMYYLQNAAAAGIQIDITDLAIGQKAYSPQRAQRTQRKTGTTDCTDYTDRREGSSLHCCGRKELSRPLPWPALDAVEAGYETRLKADWQELERKTLEILKLLPVKAVGDETLNTKPETRNPKPETRNLKRGSSYDKSDPDAFTFSEEQRAAIMNALKQFIGIYDWQGADSPVRWYYGQSYSLGLIQAAKLMGKEQPILNLIKNKEIYEKLIQTGFDLVKDNATMRIHGNIMAEMEAQMLAGTNPTHVAARLRKLFGDANSDWERLARSEMSMAAENAKIDEWGAWGVDVTDAVIPVQDTHPRCKCSNSVRDVNGKFEIVFRPAPDACPLCQSFAR